MKSETSLSKSADASLKEAIKGCTQLLNDLRLLQKGDTARFMPRVRQELAELNKAVHEFNAYHNALTTV